MKQKSFLKPRLVGSRFDENAIPLEFLKDLAVLEEMIVEVAKWEYFKQHPSRQRVPRGFTESISLKLAGIEKGCAIPAIDVFAESNDLLDPPSLFFYERAKDSIISAIEAAENNRSITDHIPEKALGYFDRIGRSLKSTEVIEFNLEDRPSPVRYTKETRRKLVLASTRMKEFTEETTQIGSIPEADQDNMTFEIQMINERKVKAPLTIQHSDIILQAFNDYKKGLRVQLQGVAKFSRQGKILEFESVEHVGVLDPMDIFARLEELRLLKDGWFEGKGIAPKDAGIDWLANAFRDHYEEDLPLPLLFPTIEGGIQVEWSIGPNEITLEIDLTGHSGEWHRLDIDKSNDDNRHLNLDEAVDWRWLASEIGKTTEEDV